MDPKDALTKAREGMDMRTVFGEPITHGDLLIIPVAKLTGGAGGGSGEDASDPKASGGGAGFGIRSVPVGVFMVKDGTVSWHPSIDVNTVIAFGIAALLTIGWVLHGPLRQRAGSK
jgi:uncharacterized spore protein YtfJ